MRPLSRTSQGVAASPPGQQRIGLLRGRRARNNSASGCPGHRGPPAGHRRRVLPLHRRGRAAGGIPAPLGLRVTIPLAPRTARAIDLTVGERSEGPNLDWLRPRSPRSSRRRPIVRRVAPPGITRPIGPDTLRHAFITAALDARVPLRDVQEAASQADPRTTVRYAGARVSLDRHATSSPLSSPAPADRQVPAPFWAPPTRGGAPPRPSRDPCRLSSQWPLLRRPSLCPALTRRSCRSQGLVWCLGLCTHSPRCP
jgi:hypothetical protein